MFNPFKKEPTMQEVVRENDRSLNRQGRDLDRERARLEREEKMLMAEIKKHAKQGNEAAARTLAKSLLQTRKQKQQLLGTKVQMNAINSNMKSQLATQKMATAMGNAANIMGKMNQAVKPQQVQKTMQEFSRQNEMMGMKEEMISDALDSALGGEDEDEEVDTAMNEVLDSIGIEIGEKLNGVGRVRVRNQAAPQQEDDSEDLSGLEARLNQLKSGQ